MKNEKYSFTDTVFILFFERKGEDCIILKQYSYIFKNLHHFNKKFAFINT